MINYSNDNWNIKRLEKKASNYEKLVCNIAKKIKFVHNIHVLKIFLEIFKKCWKKKTAAA